MGGPTMGYFLAGKAFDISEGRFLLYLAVNEVPEAPKLEGVGVKPHIYVPFSLPYSAGFDEVLEQTLKILEKE